MNTLLISKLISQLVLPPGSLILLGLLGLLFLRRWWGKGLVALSFVLFWLLATAPVRDQLLEPLESEYPPIFWNSLQAGQVKPDTAIVLLGGGLYTKAPEYSGRDQLAADALMRAWYAAELARKTGLPVYATGSTALSDAAEPEGEVMRRYLIRLGVPEEKVHAESLANNTWENAKLVKPLLEQAGIRRVILVTSAWHMPRSVWCFESQGIEVQAAPCAFAKGSGRYDVRSYLPDWQALGSSGNALHEYLGIVWYRLRYGWGD